MKFLVVFLWCIHRHRCQRKVADAMTKMTCAQEHCNRPDTTWHHNGISNSYTDENSVFDDKKISQQSWNFHQKYPNDYEIFIRIDTATLMFQARTSALSISIHIWPYYQPTSLRCKHACTTRDRVTSKVGRFAWKNENMYVMFSVLGPIV